MPELGQAGAKKKTTTRGLPAVTSGDVAYRPSRKPTASGRSPYPTRPAEVQYTEVLSEEEGEGKDLVEEEVEKVREEVVVSKKKMAKRSEESEVAALLTYMMERDRQWKEDEATRRREEGEERRREREEEANRRREEEEIRRRDKEEEVVRRKDEEAYRRSTEEERRRVRREEEDKIHEKRELLQEKLKGLGIYKDGNELGAYLDKFERIMRESKIDERDWAERLYPKLPERLCVRVAQVRDDGAEYCEVKKILLKAAGETSITYGNQLFEATSETFKSMTAGGIAEWMQRTVKGTCQGCESLEEGMLAVALALARRVLPQSGKMFIENRTIKNWGDYREALEDWMSGRQKGNYFKPLGSTYVESGRSYRGRESSYGRDSGFSRDGGYDREKSGGERISSYVTCFNCGERGHRSTECKKGSGSRPGGSGYYPRPVTCFNCGKVGHRSTECTMKKGVVPVKKEATPHKMSVLLTEDKSGKSGNVVIGVMNGVRTEILIDSGAELGSVPRALVPEKVELCGDVVVKGFTGNEKCCKSFMAKFEVGGYVKTVRAIIDESGQPGVSCIVPFTVSNREEVEAYMKAIQEYVPLDKAEISVLTRSMTKEEAKLDENESDVVEKDLWSVVNPESDCVSGEKKGPTSMSRAEPEKVKVKEEKSKSGKGHRVEKAEVLPKPDLPQATVSVESEEVRESDSSGEGTPTPLDELAPVSGEEAKLCGLAEQIGPVREGSDGDSFRKEVMSDVSLKEWRELGDRGERGFAWKKGVLVRSMYVTWEEFRDVLVVPRGFRERVLVLGHEKNGHLGAEKVSAMIGRYFVWPGMTKEVMEHCSSCEMCQRRSKYKPRRAPAVERPILSEPFETVAIDLVGPLPKGKGGNRYLLTYVCLATRWPEAVPLRNVTAKSVMEGLWSIFSRTSIPECVLSDQGSQFCGRVMKQLCEWLGIQKVRTSPYHPETNGAVERMHGTLKAILGKCLSAKLDWVSQVSFVLFVLRQMPHADSGFSPFDLVYGFRVRTPLDALYHGLFEVESKRLNVCEWVATMAERLEMMRDCAALKLAKGKESRMSYFNRGTKLREFKVGSLVLYRVPGMFCKLADSWEGPYKVIERKGEVNYKIGKVGAEKQAKVVHVNCLKEYKERFVIRRLDVVAEEQGEERSVLKGICDGYNENEMEGVLSEFEDVFSEVPGNTDRVVMSIKTGDSEPVRQSPYSVPLGIRDKVREELVNLERCGIIERCESSWASPLVPVKKADGGIRLCVDFRRLNEVTEKEPYYIPGFDEMVEMVGRGSVLSKVDLAKGFHQVVVAERDRDKTCFICPFGKFRFKRMQFGLTNAPSVFQRLMDEVLVDCQDFARVYIDDILVVSEDWESHLGHLRRLFGTLREAGLTCKRQKCSFGRRTLEFLGHQIGGGVVSVPAARVRAIRDHPRPKTRRQLRAFLGLVGYYRKFVAGFHRWSSILTPHTSTATAGELGWTEPMLEAFHRLCNELCNHVCLYVPCVDDVFMLECDASSTGIGAVLSVVRDGEQLPVAFFSRQLHGAQARYSAQELEGLAVFEAVRHFAYFLYGRKFTVITDHKGLLNLRTGRQENRRLYNWALKLSEYDFEMVYRAGKLNIVADELSRCHADGDVCDEVTPSFEEGGDVGPQRACKPTFEGDRRHEKERETREGEGRR